jgi:hypothetical protein
MESALLDTKNAKKKTGDEPVFFVCIKEIFWGM